MRRNRLFGIMLAGLMFPLIAWAQQDDMYFVPTKQKKEVKTQPQTVVRETPDQYGDSVRSYSPGYSFSYEEPYSAANDRDVDEYNRRYRLVEAKDSADAGMEDYGYTIGEDSLDDSGWVNGFEGSDEDYACARRILMFCSPTIGIPVSSPLYWDLCYGPASIYWNVYNDGWYAYAFPTCWNSWYYAPWDAGFWWTFRYSSPYWGFGFGWGYPYYGWGWGYPYWHHHYHDYAWNRHPVTRVGRPAVGRPVSGRSGVGSTTRGARVNRTYPTSGRSARTTTTRVNSTYSNRTTTTTRSQNRANRSYQSTGTRRISPASSGSTIGRSSGSVIRQSTGGVSRGARVSGGGVSRGRR